LSKSIAMKIQATNHFNLIKDIFQIGNLLLTRE
jgi:hypothetical protein